MITSKFFLVIGFLFFITGTLLGNEAPVTAPEEKKAEKHSETKEGSKEESKEESKDSGKEASKELIDFSGITDLVKKD